MIRTVLLGIDDTPASKAARGVAFDLCRRLGPRLTGVDILDPGRVVPHEPVPLGATHYKADADRTSLQRAALAWDANRAEFLAEARAAGIAADIDMATGDAAHELFRSALTSDLVVIGRDATFSSARTGDISDPVNDLLHRNPRPVMLCPAGALPVSSIVVGFDGSVAAGRSLQMFALLGLGGLGPVTVVTVSTDQIRADDLAATAVTFLRSHGIEASHMAAATDDEPADVLGEAVRVTGAGLLVMGAYGHRGWREALLGTSTSRLLERCPTSLFIHH